MRDGSLAVAIVDYKHWHFRFWTGKSVDTLKVISTPADLPVQMARIYLWANTAPTEEISHVIILLIISSARVDSAGH